MKNLITTLISMVLGILLTAHVFAQSPEKMSYQAVIRNASDALITNQTVGMRISILQGSISGTAVYVETQTPTTNINGLISIEIGSGSVVSGSFSSIDWANGLYFIKTETDPTGGSNYTISGTSQLLSVPYALHAKTAESITGGIIETDPVFGSSIASGITGTDTTNWNNKLDTEVDGSVTNELQALSISNDTIYLSDGGFVILPAGFDGQYSSLTGAPTNVSTFTNDAGYLTTFVEVDGSVTNEIQALSISIDTVYLSNGGFVKLPSANAWSLNGNSGTIDGTHFIGTIDNIPLNFKVNNQPSGRIDNVKENVFFGNNTATEFATGMYNSAFGQGALTNLTTGQGNSALGTSSLTSNTGGAFNTGLGFISLSNNTTGTYNIGVGAWSLQSNSTGIYNTGVGVGSLEKNSTGNYNTAIGHHSGHLNIAGSRNVFIGNEAGLNETGSNKLYIANSSTNPPLIYGDFATGNVGIGNNNPSARLHIGNGTLSAASSDASIFLQSGDGAGSARDWKIYVPMTNGYLGFRDMGFDNSNNGMSADALAIQYGTGNVGIGTNNPSAKLDLGSGYGASGEKFLIYNDDVSGPLAGTKTGFYLDRFSLQNNATFVFPSAAAFPGSYIVAKKDTGNTLLVPLFTILGESGNIGIGTTTPTSKLEVNGQIKVTGGTASQFLKADGSLDPYTYATQTELYTALATNFREVADEFTSTASQTEFTLTQTPSGNSKVKMYINGIRISNTTYSIAGTTLTYIPANNGSYVLTASDRIQFDYYY